MTSTNLKKSHFSNAEFVPTTTGAGRKKSKERTTPRGRQWGEGATLVRMFQNGKDVLEQRMANLLNAMVGFILGAGARKVVNNYPAV